MSIELSSAHFDDTCDDTFEGYSGDDSEVVPSITRAQCFRSKALSTAFDVQILKIIISKANRFEFAFAFTLAVFCL